MRSAGETPWQPSRLYATRADEQRRRARAVCVGAGCRRCCRRECRATNRVAPVQIRLHRGAVVVGAAVPWQHPTVGRAEALMQINT